MWNSRACVSASYDNASTSAEANENERDQPWRLVKSCQCTKVTTRVEGLHRYAVEMSLRVAIVFADCCLVSPGGGGRDCPGVITFSHNDEECYSKVQCYGEAPRNFPLRISLRVTVPHRV